MNLSDRGQVYTDVYPHANNIRALKKKLHRHIVLFPRERPAKLTWQMDFINDSHDYNHPPSFQRPSFPTAQLLSS